MQRPPLLSFLVLTAVLSLPAQQVTIKVDASKRIGPFQPVWAWVGHDEPNYSYSNQGRGLLTKLSQLSMYPVHDRTHNLLTTGDGTASLKWGSTNAFTRDASGKPVYNWKIIDRIFNVYRETGVTPLVEIGFMPEALSTHPEPYRHNWPKTFDTGWTYPPSSYEEWSDLVYHFVQHLVERYGAAETAKWEWEVWNEPDIFYWHGTREEYFKLYDYTVAAVRRALPRARVGGPATTGPANQKAADFLRAFLEHCATGKNYVTGTQGVPLDFISFHAKGKAAIVNGHVELNIGANLRDIDAGFAIVEKFPTLRRLPVNLSESDPESCAACDAASHPENSYRLTSQYASYQAELLHRTMELAERHHINLEGMTAWAFTFPGQPIFGGLRAFTTDGIDLPLLNGFRMFGRMTGDRVAAESSGSAGLDDLVSSKTGTKSDVNLMAARDSHTLRVLVWNYHDDVSEGAVSDIQLKIKGLPKDVSKASMEHWRVDRDHSNAYTLWKSMGSPQEPAPDQRQALNAAGQLGLLESLRWVSVDNGAIEIKFSEPQQGLSLVQLSW